MSRFRLVLLSILTVGTALIVLMAFWGAFDSNTNPMPQALGSEESSSTSKALVGELQQGERIAANPQYGDHTAKSARPVSLGIRVVDETGMVPLPAFARIAKDILIAGPDGLIEVQCPAHTSQLHLVIGAKGYESRAVDLEIESSEKRVTIKLEPLCSPGILVKLPGGAPAQGAWVTVVARSNEALGPRWVARTAGQTDSAGRMHVQATPGSWLLAQSLGAHASGSACLRADCSDLEIDLVPAQGLCSLGLRDAATAAPMEGIACTLEVPGFFPPLAWSGRSLAGGLLPLLADPDDATLTLAAGEGFALLDMNPARRVKLGTLASENDPPIRWVDIDRSLGGRVRVIAAGTGVPPPLSIQSTSRRVETEPGLFLDLPVGAVRLQNGILDLHPPGSDSTELQTQVFSPGYDFLDTSSIVPAFPRGAMHDVRVEPRAPGRIQITGAFESGQQVTRADQSIWLFIQGVSTPIARLPIGPGGGVANVPYTGTRLLVAASPAATSPLGTLEPQDLYREPPVAFPLTAQSTIEVHFSDNDHWPNPSMRALGSSGPELLPAFSGSVARFLQLQPGTYLVGTADQVASSARLPRREHGSASFVRVGAGETVRIEARPDWYLLDELTNKVQIVSNDLEGLMVATLSQSMEELRYSFEPLGYFPVDRDGHASVDLNAAVRFLAVGTWSIQRRAFVPLGLFEATKKTLHVRARHLFVRTAPTFLEPQVVDLRRSHDGLLPTVRVVGVIPPAGAWGDLGLIPLGEYSIGLAGGPSSIWQCTAEPKETYSLELSEEGSFQLVD